MNESLNITLLKLAGDTMPGGDYALEHAVVERVNVRRLNVSTYRAIAIAGVGAMVMGVGASLAPTSSAAHAQSLEPLAVMSMAPSTLLDRAE